MVTATFHVRTEILVIPGTEERIQLYSSQLPRNPVDKGSNLDVIIPRCISKHFHFRS